MSLWRLELLRLTRTRRGLALFAVYLLFGFVGPLTARYLSDLLELAGRPDRQQRPRDRVAPVVEQHERARLVAARAQLVDHDPARARRAAPSRAIASRLRQDWDDRRPGAPSRAAIRPRCCSCCSRSSAPSAR